MKYSIFLPTSSNIKGVIVYFSPTQFGRLETPTKSSKQITAIAGLYVSQGYSIIFPNYLGYLDVDNYPHPYLLYPQVNTKSAILCLNNAISKIKAAFPLIKNVNLFSIGYSEGASYSIWLQKCL